MTTSPSAGQSFQRFLHAATPVSKVCTGSGSGIEAALDDLFEGWQIHSQGTSAINANNMSMNPQSFGINAPSSMSMPPVGFPQTAEPTPEVALGPVLEEVVKWICDTPSAMNATASSPSGVHMGHYKVGALFPKIGSVLAKMMSYPFMYAFSPKRWQSSIHMMLEKIQGRPIKNLE